MTPKFSQNLFDLTPEQEGTSKMLYNGKIIKCLVAPYHTYQQLEGIVPFTKNTYLFPEREISIPQLTQLVSVITNSPSTDEFRIITTNQNIIIDMFDGCVRVLTESGDVVDCPCKTFMANIHTIRYELLENEAHQLSKNERTQSNQKIQILIDKINSKPTVTAKEKEQILAEIDLIGEPIIASKLREMAHDYVKVKK